MAFSHELQAISDAAPAHHDDYFFEVPDGMWRARLDDLRWGRRTNRICDVTDLDTGCQYDFWVSP